MLIRNRNKISQITSAASIIFLFVAGYILVDLSMSMKKRQEIATDLAMANDAKYGLFNIEKWKPVVAEIIVDKVRKQVPDWANEVINQKTRNQVASFLKEKLGSFFNETVRMNSFDVSSHMTGKYGLDNYEKCVAALSEESLNLSSHSWKLTWMLITLIFLMFVIYFAISALYRTELHYYTLLLGVMILLLGGILTPMIDIDARISQIELLFLGETIQFNDQVIFFQSKSIFDVVTLLIKEGDAKTVGVGVLIFIFSIIFPSIKLFFSALVYRFPHNIAKNRIIKFFILESSKWSMADVMVIAILMSYIGLSSIIGAQLDHFSKFDEVQLLSTHKHTNLQMGFFIFTAYCMSGTVFAYAAKRKLLSGIQSPKQNIPREKS